MHTALNIFIRLVLSKIAYNLSWKNFCQKIKPTNDKSPKREQISN
jgi:hypothetical protein